MENTQYSPDIYTGKDPYLYVSCHPEDRSRILPVLQRMEMHGFRFWLNDGIAPGMETDEVIAEHIEGCGVFIAFLSKRYLTALDIVDELNYSRDVGKEYLLIYLEDVSLPAGLDMRFMRAQSISAFALTEDAVFDQLIHISGVTRFYGIAEESLRDEAQKIFGKLEELYPEHKVFALDAVGHQLARDLSALYVKAGYPSVQRLMQDYGFASVSTDQARLLRSSVIYQPGFEPAIVKRRIDVIMAALENAYPSKVITDSLTKNQKSLNDDINGFSVWLGYDSGAAMLSAYGFKGMKSDAVGRTAIDHDKIIEQLKKRYALKKKPTSITMLLNDNQDLKAALKTMINKARELFGSTMLQYMKRIGLIVPEEKDESSSGTALHRAEILDILRKRYQEQETPYGTWEEAEQSLSGLILKKNVNGAIYLHDCGTCDVTMKIPYGISWIAKEAFAGQHDCTTMILPPTVKEIKEAAFSDCTGLETLVLPEGLERIGNQAFVGCLSLKKIVFPRSLKAIGNKTFEGCELLCEVAFSNPRTNVQSDAFDGCPYVLEDLQDAGASPAADFELKVDKKNNAKIIAYTGTDAVVVIPEMIGGHPIVSIEKGCFKGNENVREVYINDHISAMNGDVFKACVNLQKIHISEAVTSLTNSVFAGCTALTETNIPNAMSDVQRGLFKDAPLTTIYIGKGVERISPDAFCKGEADFATGAFFKKRTLENLIIDASNENFSAAGTMLLSKDGKVLVAELGDPEKAEIPEGVEEIGAQAYEKLGTLRSVTFPASLKRIGEKAFAGTMIREVVFPPSLAEIGMQAFSYCRALTAAELNDGLCTIGQQAFEGCPIENVFIPASVESVGSDSFLAISTYQGQIVQRFRIDPANTQLLADGIALYQKTTEGCTLLKAYGLHGTAVEDAEGITYTVAAGTTQIAPHAFARCSSLSGLTLPDGLISIGEMAFWDCTSLKTLHIPPSCVDVSPKAFFGTEISLA